MKPNQPAAAPYRLSRVAILLCLLALPGLGRAAAPDDGAWQKQIAELESRLFEPILAGDEVDRLLEQLKLPDTRAKAAKRLAEQGPGHVARIITFAHDCPDIEARQACADVVEALDASYRTTALGKQLGAIYREHTETLLPAYWARFRKDPLDPRAVAMLMHGDAERVYAFLAKSEDHRDPIRYLLLRLRELEDGDKFAHRHIFEHSGSGVALVVGDVFPHCNPGTGYGFHRVVGHVVLHRIHVGFRLAGNEPPRLDLLTVERRATYVCQYADPLRPGTTGWAYLAENCFYNPLRKGQEPAVAPRRLRPVSGPVPGLCRLPELKLSRGQVLQWVNNNFATPWWAQSYLATAYRKQISFSSRSQGESPPELVEAKLSELHLPKPGTKPPVPLRPGAPSMVVLPPRIAEGADPSIRVAAELLCDYLAEEFAAAGIARVIDRGQLDRVLAERALQPGLSKTLLSYDAMVRLEVDTARLVAELRLGLIDLSTGNMLGQQTFAWPPAEADLPRMISLAEKALAKVGKPAVGKLSARLPGVADVEANVRMRPLGLRLAKLFESSLGRSDRILPVRHLEAGTAKEESLLLLLGLSRLPGGRVFAPQADATIALRLREGEAAGKTFEETPVEIGVRLQRGAAPAGEWIATSGAVKDFDRLAEAAWEKLARSLTEARPDAARQLLDEMAVRRQQAEAELKAGADLDPNLPKEQRALAELAHVETALKIDPTHEPAAYRLILVLFDLVASRLNGPADTATRHRLILESARYMERFDGDPAHRATVLSHAWLGVQFTPLSRLFDRDTVQLTPELRRLLDAMQVLIEKSLSGDIRGFDSAGTHRMLLVYYRGMKAAEVPLPQRQQWLDEMLRRCDEQAKQIDKLDAFSRPGVLEGYLWFHVRAADLALDDGDIPRAKQLIAQVQSRFKGVKDVNDDLVQLMRRVTVLSDDAAALAEFDRWAKGLNENMVQPMVIRWPAIEVFRNEEPVGRDMIRSVMPEIKGVNLRHAPLHRNGTHTSIAGLVEGNRRLYLALDGHNEINWGSFEGTHSSSEPQAVGYVPLDEAGRPIGKTYSVMRPIGNDLWDTLELLPRPPTAKPLQVLDAKYVAGRLCLGTLRNGLLTFDPKAEKWSSFGPEQGLPKEGVFAIYPLDERTLFCVGKSASYGNCDCYTLQLPEGKITLRHRVNRSEPAPRLFWREGKRLMAWSDTGLCDDLLGRELKFTQRSCGVPYGWNAPGGHLDTNYPAGFVSMAEIGGRRFVTNAGLHEFDSTGKIVRSWWGGNRYDGDYGRAYRVPLPPDCPVESTRMVTMGTLVVFIHAGPFSGVLAWDPKNDTWYGPLRPDFTDQTHGGTISCGHALGTGSGLWLTSSDGITFVAAEDLLNAAKNAGRVLTTAEYRRRQREIIAAMPPLDRAKAAFSMHQFDVAEELFDQVLKDDPMSAEALLLMGYLHDLWCANQPEEALKFYQRLAELKSNPNASFSGMYQRLILLRNQKRWPEALATIEDILRTFPKLYEHYQHDIDWWRDYIHTQLPKKDMKPPAAGTSKEEGPTK